MRRAEGPDRVDHRDLDAGPGAYVLYRARNTFRYAARADGEALARDLQSALHRGQRRPRPAALAEFWGGKYPAIITLWRNAYGKCIPHLDYNVEIRRLVCSTNVNESLNARYRRAVRPAARPGSPGGCRCSTFAITFEGGQLFPNTNRSPDEQLRRRGDGSGFGSASKPLLAGRWHAAGAVVGLFDCQDLVDGDVAVFERQRTGG